MALVGAVGSLVEVPAAWVFAPVPRSLIRCPPLPLEKSRPLRVLAQSRKAEDTAALS